MAGRKLNSFTDPEIHWCDEEVQIENKQHGGNTLVLLLIMSLESVFYYSRGGEIMECYKVALKVSCFDDINVQRSHISIWQFK